MYKIINLPDGCTFKCIVLGNKKKKIVGIKVYQNNAKFFGFYINNQRHGFGIKQFHNGKYNLVKYNKGIKVL